MWVCEKEKWYCVIDIKHLHFEVIRGDKGLR
jgi:hypothetical protein